MIDLPEGTSCIVALNAGSSSIKLTVFQNTSTFEPLLKVSAELIGQPNSIFRKRIGSHDEEVAALTAQTYPAAIDEIMTWLFQQVPASALQAVGHRVVHGGARYTKPVIISAQVLTDLESYAKLDPNHLPFEIEAVQAMQQHLPAATHVVCFDTAFYANLPHLARMLAIPRQYWQEGLQRYGFHGLSYEYLLSEVQRTEADIASSGRLIFAHLGSGVSLTAVRDGQAIDTTMGFSPASGVMMSTRTGDLDPELIIYLQKRHNLSPDQVSDLVNKQSGLLGVSEQSADMYTLLEAEDTNPKAKDAVDLFCYQVKKAIASLAAAMGGLDMLVFSGGMGFHAPRIRSRICQDLGFLGVHLNESANQVAADLISDTTAHVKVKVLETDEELVIAKHVAHIIQR